MQEVAHAVTRASRVYITTFIQLHWKIMILLIYIIIHAAHHPVLETAHVQLFYRQLRACVILAAYSYKVLVFGSVYISIHT